MVGTESISKGRVSLPPLSLSRLGFSYSSLLGSISGGEFSLSLINLSCVSRSHRELRVEDRSDTVIDWSHRKAGVSYTESSSISDVLDLLENSIGIHIRVSPM